MNECGQMAGLPWPGFREGHAASLVSLVLLPPHEQEWLPALNCCLALGWVEKGVYGY